MSTCPTYLTDFQGCRPAVRVFPETSSDFVAIRWELAQSAAACKASWVGQAPHGILFRSAQSKGKSVIYDNDSKRKGDDISATPPTRRCVLDSKPVGRRFSASSCRSRFRSVRHVQR